MKSERLKKLEIELQELEHWLKLGLVPKKDLEKHQGEIDALKKKVEEEKDRLRALKENGDSEEFTVPKRSAQNRQSYQEPHTMPGVDIEGSGDTGLTDVGLDMETESYDTESTTISDEDSTEEMTSFEDEEEDPFSDKNRWRRGILEDPDADSW